MAVPSSGTLSMQDIAQERLNSTYGSGNVSGPISMYNLVNGGNTGGAVTSGNTYPAVNTGCLPNPANRTANQLTNLTDEMGTANQTLYYNSNIGDASNLSAGDFVYTDSSLTTPAYIIFGTQTGSSASTTVCGAGTALSGFRTGAGGNVDSYAPGEIIAVGQCQA